MIKSRKKKDKKFTLKSKIKVKGIIKKPKITIVIHEKKPESPWEDENRYFKGQFNKEKRSMFFE